MKSFILFLVLFVFTNLLNAQVDSSVIYVNDLPRWKTVYDGFTTYFYNIDTIGNRRLCAKWIDNEQGRTYHRIDTITFELRLTYKDVWTDGNKYSYMVDTAGVVDLTAVTYYYGASTANPEHIILGPNVEVTQRNGSITVSATLPIVSVKVYSVEGKLIFETFPFKKRTKFPIRYSFRIQY